MTSAWDGPAVLLPRQRSKLARSAKDREHATAQTLNPAIVVVGIDIGKNSLPIVGHDERGAIIVPWEGATVAPLRRDGKAGRIKNSGTPWGYRDAKWAQVMVGVDPDPANKEKISAWAKDYWNMDEGDDRIRATYRKNYARLAKIKKRYDSTNLFRVNQNIKTAR